MDNCWISCQVINDMEKFTTISSLLTCILMYLKKCFVKTQSHRNWNAAAEIIWTHCESACCHRCYHERYVGKEFHSFSTTKIIWFALVLKSRNDGFHFFFYPPPQNHIQKPKILLLSIHSSYIEFRNDFEIMGLGHIIKKGDKIGQFAKFISLIF